MSYRLLAAVVVMILGAGLARAEEEAMPPSRGGPVQGDELRSWTGDGRVLAEEPVYTDEPTTDEERAALAIVKEAIPPLTHPLKGHWPIVVWAAAANNRAEWKAWAERGISPLFNGCSSPKAVERLAPELRYFQEAGVPLIILPQGWVQRAFHKPPHGTGCEHLPPAGPAAHVGEVKAPNRYLTCPSWMLQNPALQPLAKNVTATCEALKAQGIEPASMWLDFESGVYLRNGAEKEENVLAALAATAECPRCREAFPAERYASPAAYSALAQEVRAKVQKEAFVDPVHGVFPGLPTGNFFAWPVRRLPLPEGMYPAYGYDGSGFTVAQPRCYFTPGWGGGGSNQAATDWAVFYYCIRTFSDCAETLKEGEVMVPWVGWLYDHPNAPKRAAKGACINSAAGYREMAIHTLLRGAKTIAVFEPSRPGVAMPEEYAKTARAGLGRFVLSVGDIQQGLDAVLPYQELIDRGKVLNLEIGGIRTELNDDSACWSGVGTDGVALVRTVSFKTEQEREVRVFGKAFRLPFGVKGRFFKLYPDGRVEAVGE